ncbi:FMN-binding protein [Lachnospiraceae bacterium ZAX-1]
MKKLTTIFTSMICLLILIVPLAGCFGRYKDGVYHTEMKEFEDGWKDTVEITIVHGKIDKISWDAISESPDIPINKKQYSKSGLYGMLQGGANNEWCDQAKAAEDYVLAYGVSSFSTDSEGYTDAISGCTIEVDKLALLAKECLEQAQK